MKILTWIKQFYLENYDRPSTWFCLFTGFSYNSIFLHFFPQDQGGAEILFFVIPCFMLAVIIYMALSSLELRFNIAIPKHVSNTLLYHVIFILSCIVGLPSFIWHLYIMCFFIIPIVLFIAFIIFLRNRRKLKLSHKIDSILTVINLIIVLFGSPIYAASWLFVGGFDSLYAVWSLFF